MGPEILARVLGSGEPRAWRAVVVAERSALLAHAAHRSDVDLGRFVDLPRDPTPGAIDSLPSGVVGLVDPRTGSEAPVPGRPSATGAVSSLAALDGAIDLLQAGIGQALITAPMSKEQVARYAMPDFRGHTDHLARRAGLARYGRDYLMAFLAAELQVALLSTHVPLAEALRRLSVEAVVDALRCLDRYGGGRLALAALNPHAGEGGLMGDEEERCLRPAVERARSEGIDVVGPWSADSLFARARRGEVDWVLALYHDQGLIPVKTLAFGSATNWTMGLPYLRTSVDHGTAFDIAGQGVADVGPLQEVIETTLSLLRGDLPRRRG